MPLINLFQEDVIPSSFIVNIKEKLEEQNNNSAGPYWISVIVHIEVDPTSDGIIASYLKYIDSSDTEQLVELVCSLTDATACFKSSAVIPILRNNVNSEFVLQFNLMSSNIGESRLNYHISIAKFK